jgi:hypothetical protein
MAGINFTDEREYAPKLKFKNNGVLVYSMRKANSSILNVGGIAIGQQ